MNTNTRKKIGAYLLVVGIFLLAVSVLLAFSVGGAVVPVLFFLSILVNTAGVTALRRRD